MILTAHEQRKCPGARDIKPAKTGTAYISKLTAVWGSHLTLSAKYAPDVPKCGQGDGAHTWGPPTSISGELDRGSYRATLIICKLFSMQNRLFKLAHFFKKILNMI